MVVACTSLIGPFWPPKRRPRRFVLAGGGDCTEEVRSQSTDVHTFIDDPFLDSNRTISKHLLDGIWSHFASFELAIVTIP